MDDLFSIYADSLFSSANNRSAGLNALANQALSSGIEKYQNKDYKGAALDFKRSFGLSPHSDFAYEATKYQSMAYNQLGETEKAIDAYEVAIKLNPTDDRLHLDIGNLYFGQEQYGDAIDSYELAVRIYDDPTNRFSLGQGYLKAGRYNDAETQFRKIIQHGGLDSRNGYFGLGKTYSAQGKYNEAISQFERAIQKDKTFYSAYAEMGFTYADSGNLDKAQEIQKFLEAKDASTAQTLDDYISKATTPKLMFAYADSSFQYFMRPNTKVSSLSNYLSAPDASRSVSMVFQFNKAMDRSSVEDIFNWNIKRSTETGPGMKYNHGLPIASTEVNLPLFPKSVYYDKEKMTATVRFDITQNSNADGTIDPSHIVFGFNGIDDDGNQMDANYDQYMGFSRSF
jgi:tetratricopeptide (TPR) repeat protein